MRVKSEVDWWFKAIVWSTCVVVAGVLLAIPPSARAIGLAAGIPVLVFLLWIYFGTWYELRDDHLYCRSGPFSERISYEAIRSVRLSQNVLSSLALSLRRIEIKQHGKGYLMGTTFISPVNRQEFLQELARRCKNLDRTI